MLLETLLLAPHDPDYPECLNTRLEEPPVLTVSGSLVTNQRRIAIVGSREPDLGGRRCAFALGYHLARAGVIVVSGGAVGIDEHAHRGALRAGGATWCVACTGKGKSFPEQNETLFDTIAEGPSRMIWPFPDGTPKDKLTPRFRNGVLVGLAECVVVIQAGIASGTRNAATRAYHLDVPLFVVPGMPWLHEFEGSMLELMRGAHPFWSIPWFFQEVGLPPPDMDDPNAQLGDDKLPKGLVPRRPRRSQTIGDLPLFPVDRSTWSEDEKSVFSLLSLAPTQRDRIIASAGLPTSSTLTALLTLSLKDVVVEGPDGFFRRRIAL